MQHSFEILRTDWASDNSIESASTLEQAKQVLADYIHEFGPWPERAKFAITEIFRWDEDGWSFSKSRVVYTHVL